MQPLPLSPRKDELDRHRGGRQRQTGVEVAAVQARRNLTDQFFRQMLTVSKNVVDRGGGWKRVVYAVNRRGEELLLGGLLRP